ncbi:BTAD domain-containing putative transcriptional regulator [Actinoallomurus sp. NPDC050550]|uniref:AfsR/SARP family transcriptional regulator n=1 Tax=Actinoallomurus sp. NPDC050550 TaxID=3154937 RepID=UPI0033E112B7
MATPYFAVLGPVEVTRAGRPIPLPGVRTRSLLAALLISANQAVPVDDLIEAVWDRGSPTHPRSALQNAVFRLRGALGDALTLESAGAGYRLWVDDDQLDLLQMERALQIARGESAMWELEKIVRLWRGTPLSNVDSKVLRRDMVPRLTDRYLTAVERWAELCLQHGRHEAVAENLPTLMTVNSYREKLIGYLMVAYFQDGRSADALLLYERTRRSINENLGIDPSTSLQQLHIRILRRDEEPTLNFPLPTLGQNLQAHSNSIPSA